MKYLSLAILLTTSSVFAADFCQFQSTNDFTDSQKSIATNETHQFNVVERKMIFAMMKEYSKGWRSYANEYQAVADFNDEDTYNDRDQSPGTNAGEIVYFNYQNKKVALIHFWPGDNEFGAFFEVLKDGKFKELAKIGDGDLECSK